MRKNQIVCGQVRALSDNVEEDRSIQFINSTYSRDRHGTVLNQDGWDLEGFKRNPGVSYQHNLSGNFLQDPNPDFIIGKDINPRIEGSGSARMLVGTVQFEPANLNPLAEKIFRKVLFGSLSRSSVGFIEKGKGKYGAGNEARGGSNETYYFDGQELLEWSIVNVPSNPDAGKRGIADKMRDQEKGALRYAYKMLSDKYTLGQIKYMTPNQILILLDAKDLEIKENDPVKLKKIFEDIRLENEIKAYNEERDREIEEERRLFREGKL